MRKILVFQHVAFEILGTLNPLLKNSGFRIRYVNFDRDPQARPDLEGYNGLVVLGGPMNVDQVDLYPHLATEIELIEKALEMDIPVLGICLGAQLIARALGAEVRPNEEKEIGWYEVSPTPAGRSDALIGCFGETERIFQWHGDTFDIPSQAVALASSPTCANQAFRFGDRVYGLQFHLEVDEALVERWLRVPIHREEIAALGGKVDPENIRRETALRIEELKGLSNRTFHEFVKLFGIQRRHRILESR
ncbi:MAG: gamma-glutamyl-gamma-aminobutyrate hydrolase family protein [Candidatus Binatia bacterium]